VHADTDPIHGLIDAVYAKLTRGDSLGNVTELNKLATSTWATGAPAARSHPKMCSTPWKPALTSTWSIAARN
jgi:hypothetical protein